MLDTGLAGKVALITGASRGLGLAVAEQLLDRKCHVLALSRRPSASLETHAAQRGAKLEQWAVDVSATDVASRLEAWLCRLSTDAFERAVLINNAAVIGRVGPVDRTDAASLAQRLEAAGRAGTCARPGSLARRWSG